MEPPADKQHHQEKTNCYRGTVKIDISHLQFESNRVRGVRTVSQKNVERLAELFHLEGCFHLQPEHYVPALIAEDVLENALSQSNLTRHDILQNAEPRELQLPEGESLTVLYGQHRLLAANKVLLDKWWVVDLYSTRMEDETVAAIREEQSNSQPFSDGDVYRNLRFHQLENNEEEAEKWLARLSQGKRKRLRQMREKIGRLNRGFDKLLPFIGLWSALQLGPLNRLLPLKCPEELLCYLERIFKDYSSVLINGDHLDPGTVSKIERLTPKHSSHDAARIRDLMERWEIFPAIRTQRSRDRILCQLLKIERILSLRTFFQDTIYFETCSRVLRQLLPSKFGGSMRDAFFRSFTGINQARGQVKLQDSEDTFMRRPGDRTLQRELGYKQLFLAAMRCAPAFDRKFARLNSKHEATPLEVLKEEHWYKIAKLALNLGFDNAEIQKIRNRASQDPDEMMARQLLYQFRPREIYAIDEDRFNSLARHVAEQIRLTATRLPRQRQPEFTTDLEMQPLMERCNGPSIKSYQKDRDYLFADVMFNYHPICRSHLTSLAIRRDIFVSFFGDTVLPAPGMASPTSSYSPPPEVDATEDSSPNLLHLSDPPPDSPHVELDAAEDSSPDPLHASVPSWDSALPRLNTQTTQDGLVVHSQDPDAAAELFESDPQACGFEDEASEINKFHQLQQDQSPSEVVTAFLSDKASDRVLVIYIWDKRQYAKFINTSNQQLVFEEVACSLADEQYGFYTLEDGRFAMRRIRDLWDAARRSGLVLARPKLDTQSGAGLDLQNRTWEEMLSLIAPNVGKCPICDAEIDADLLSKYTSGGDYLPIKMQLELCKKHMMEDAKAEWSERGYPSIDWTMLEERLMKVKPHIQRLIESEKGYFEASLEESIQAGQAGRGLLRSYLHSYGYYGPRATDILGEAIGRQFTSELKKASTEKKVIKDRGVPVYILDVLIPETLTKFVAEDMRVCDDEARSILEQSRELGEILNCE